MLFCKWGVSGPELERTCGGDRQGQASPRPLGLESWLESSFWPQSHKPTGGRGEEGGSGGGGQGPSSSREPTAQDGPGLGERWSGGPQARRGRLRAWWRSLETRF